MNELRKILLALQQLDASLEAFHLTASNETVVNSRSVLRNALQTIGATRLDDGRPARMTPVAEAAAALGVTL